ncbi:MAG: hypothetical protein KAR06_02975 [Deltaproteobacteria bacterium]|nr:hypothetical protein [Deltaproteobacteria bacterium]
MEWWSDTDDVIDLPAAAADTNLPDVVVVGLPTDFVLVRAVAIFKCRHIENTNGGGVNAIEGAQDIRVKKSTGAWGVDDIAAINLADNQWAVAASTREGGDVIEGDIDIKGEMDGNATYNFRFEDADVDLDFLRLNDVQMGIKAYFTIG